MCQEFYVWYRQEFPKPALIVTSAAADIRRDRVRSRMRETDLGTEQAHATLEEYFEKFIRAFSDRVVLRIDTTLSDIGYEKEVAQVLAHTSPK